MKKRMQKNPPSKTKKIQITILGTIKIDEAVLKIITTDLQPLSVVEDAGFQSLLHLIDPRYQLPSRKTVTRMLPDGYAKRVKKIKQELD